MADVTGSPIKQIKEARQRSNQAMKAHDLVAFVSHFDQDYCVTYGGGEKRHSLAEETAGLEQFFRDNPTTWFERTPDSVMVAEDARLAFEVGRWKGGPEGRAQYRGRYSAGWRRTETGWKIHCELFVTLKSA